MAIRSIAQLKAWFKRGNYPTELQYSDWIDSFYHKEDDKITINSVDKLAEKLNNKYNASEGLELERKHEELSSDFCQQSADAAKEFKNIHKNLEELEAEIRNHIAGRYWNETNSTPTAEGYYGNLSALKELPKRLGLGRYLVTDNRVRRKLNSTDSTRFDDGSPALLDGTMGQCMWCWNAHYYTTWREGDNTIEAITFLPIGGKNSIYVPAGGLSWLGGAVIDRTEQKLCSVISTDTRYRGGNGKMLDYPNLSDSSPQRTQLGMISTSLPSKNYSALARKRGEGWEANWFVARAVVEYTLRIILGTRNSQAPYNPTLDANGLYQGGLGAGVTSMPNWSIYNGMYPLVPTNIGVNEGDLTGVINYRIANAFANSVDYVAPVPVFFGLINPYGHILHVIGGVVISNDTGNTFGYIAISMKTPLNYTSTNGLLLASKLSNDSGFIKKYTTHRLFGFPTEVGGSDSTFFCDYYNNPTSPTTPLSLNAYSVGGAADNGVFGGASYGIFSSFEGIDSYRTSPLCYFAENPIIDE